MTNFKFDGEEEEVIQAQVKQHHQERVKARKG
jgi:hypothetical protein